MIHDLRYFLTPEMHVSAYLQIETLHFFKEDQTMDAQSLNMLK